MDSKQAAHKAEGKETIMNTKFILRSSYSLSDDLYQRGRSIYCNIDTYGIKRETDFYNLINDWTFGARGLGQYSSRYFKKLKIKRVL